MGIGVRTATPESVILTAPITPNINHRETVFGGSASAICILAAWSLIHLRLLDDPELHPRIVIQRNQMEYLKPVTGTFEASCRTPGTAPWERLARSLTRKAIGRIELSADLISKRTVTGRFTGTFVVSSLDRPHE